MRGLESGVGAALARARAAKAELARPNVNDRERDNQIQRACVLEVRIHLPPAERCYGAGGEDGNFVAFTNRWSAAMPQPNDLSRSLVALDQDSTIIAVVEMSQSSWLVGGVLPGCKRRSENPSVRRPGSPVAPE